MKQKRLPSLATLLNPTKVVTGKEKEQLEAQHDRLDKEMGGS